MFSLPLTSFVHLCYYDNEIILYPTHQLSFCIVRKNKNCSYFSGQVDVWFLPGHCPGSLLSTALWPSHCFHKRHGQLRSSAPSTACQCSHSLSYLAQNLLSELWLGQHGQCFGHYPKHWWPQFSWSKPGAGHEGEILSRATFWLRNCRNQPQLLQTKHNCRNCNHNCRNLINHKSCNCNHNCPNFFENNFNVVTIIYVI